MGERYLITGVQLGMLKALKDEADVHHLIDNIIDNQFVCNTNNTNIGKDAKKMSEILKVIDDYWSK